MLKFIIIAVVGYVFYRALKSWMIGTMARPEDLNGRSGNAVDDVLVQDPVCKTYIAQRSAIALHEGDEVLYFCSEACRERYRREHASENKS